MSQWNLNFESVKLKLLPKIANNDGKIDYKKNPSTNLKEEHFEKRYEIPLHNVKKSTAGFTSQRKNL